MSSASVSTRDHHEWLGAVTSNRTLATDLTGTTTTTGDGIHPQVTSFTTMPGGGGKPARVPPAVRSVAYDQ